MATWQGHWSSEGDGALRALDEADELSWAAVSAGGERVGRFIVDHQDKRLRGPDRRKSLLPRLWEGEGPVARRIHTAAAAWAQRLVSGRDSGRQEVSITQRRAWLLAGCGLAGLLAVSGGEAEGGRACICMQAACLVDDAGGDGVDMDGAGGRPVFKSLRRASMRAPSGGSAMVGVHAAGLLERQRQTDPCATSTSSAHRQTGSPSALLPAPNCCTPQVHLRLRAP